MNVNYMSIIEFNPILNRIFKWLIVVDQNKSIYYDKKFTMLLVIRVAYDALSLVSLKTILLRRLLNRLLSPFCDVLSVCSDEVQWEEKLKKRFIWLVTTNLE